MGKHRLHNYQRGSVTIEATISLVVFLCSFLLLMSIINVCRVQAKIHEAIIITASEISSYSYLYEILQLNYLKQGIGQAGESASGTINNTLESADNALASFGTLYDLIGSSGGSVADTDITDMGSLTSTAGTLKDAVSQGKAEAGNIAESIRSLSDQVKGVADDPIGFVKSLAAMVGTKAMDIGMSHLIAAPLTKALVVGHLSNSMDATAADKYSAADDYLNSMGVEGGLDGLNFNCSTIFASDSLEDINIVVVYKVRMVKMPFYGDISYTFVQSASARGWLGGS